MERNPGDTLDDVDVLLMSAGVGRRMGGSVRKQWVLLRGRPLFAFTAQRFLEMGASSLIVVVHEEDLEEASHLCAAMVSQVPCALRVVAGGRERQDSVRCGLSHATREYVLIHDAARPFVRGRDVFDVVSKARATGAATLGHPARDSLKRVADDTTGSVSIDREGVWQVQTPQVFQRSLIAAAHARAQADAYTGTDDTVLLERIGHPSALVKGSPWNVKITEPEDLVWMKLWDDARSEWD